MVSYSFRAKDFLKARFLSRRVQSFTPIQAFGFRLMEMAETIGNSGETLETMSNPQNNGGRLPKEPPADPRGN